MFKFILFIKGKNNKNADISKTILIIKSTNIVFQSQSYSNFEEENLSFKNLLCFQIICAF